MRPRWQKAFLISIIVLEAVICVFAFQIFPVIHPTKMCVMWLPKCVIVTYSTPIDKYETGPVGNKGQLFFRNIFGNSDPERYFCVRRKCCHCGQAWAYTAIILPSNNRVSNSENVFVRVQYSNVISRGLSGISDYGVENLVGGVAKIFHRSWGWADIGSQLPCLGITSYRSLVSSNSCIDTENNNANNRSGNGGVFEIIVLSCLSVGVITFGFVRVMFRRQIILGMSIVFSGWIIGSFAAFRFFTLLLG